MEIVYTLVSSLMGGGSPQAVISMFAFAAAGEITDARARALATVAVAHARVEAIPWTGNGAALFSFRLAPDMTTNPAAPYTSLFPWLRADVRDTASTFPGARVPVPTAHDRFCVMCVRLVAPPGRRMGQPRSRGIAPPLRDRVTPLGFPG